MSLVNDMLRDLDKRKRLPPQAARVSNVMEKHYVTRQAASPWIAGAVALSVLAGIAGGYFIFRGTPEAPALPVADAAPVAAPAIVETDTTAPVSINVMDIVEESSSDGGFSLRIKAGQAVQYKIVSRDTYGITLHLDGVDNYSRGATSFSGMSVLLESGGANIDLDLDTPTDFTVFEDADTASFDIVLDATYRQARLSSAEPEATTNFAQAPQQTVSPPVQPQPTHLPTTQNVAVQEPLLSAEERNTPVRVTRELSLEQRDASTSRSAIALMQGGQLLEAYQSLLAFIGDNPEAHQSRATLATLLLAQQDMMQADAVVEEGLAQAPNFSPYKKIKARILMQQNSSTAALALLRNVPPAVGEDAEYHEILASLYQQNNEHPLAVATYQELLRRDNRQGRWWAGLAVSLEAQGKKQDALSSFQQALQSSDLDSGLRQYSQARIRALSGNGQ